MKLILSPADLPPPGHTAVIKNAPEVGVEAMFSRDAYRVIFGPIAVEMGREEATALIDGLRQAMEAQKRGKRG